MKDDLLLLCKILSLSVIVYQLDLWKNKSEQDSSGSELHARDRYAVADKITAEFDK